MMLIRDVSVSKPDFSIALLVALMAGFLQYGFVIGLIVGTLLTYLVPVVETILCKNLHVKKPAPVIIESWKNQ